MKINDKASLQIAIKNLELKEKQQKQELQEYYLHTLNRLRPTNLIKDGIQQAMSSPGLVKTVTGVGISLLSKNMLLKTAAPIIGQLIGNSLNKPAQNGKAIGKLKAYSAAIYNNLFKKKEDQL